MCVAGEAARVVQHKDIRNIRNINTSLHLPSPPHLGSGIPHKVVFRHAVFLCKEFETREELRLNSLARIDFPLNRREVNSAANAPPQASGECIALQLPSL